MLTFNAIERGWFAETGAHSSELRNTSAGIAGDLGVLRTFLVFDLTALHDSISQATLHLELEAYLSADAQETFVVSGVVAPARSMTMTYRPGAAGGQAIFDALGSGVEYGRATITASDVGRIIEISLNDRAKADMKEAAGGLFAIGIQLEHPAARPDDDDLLKMIRFSAASEDRKHQLVVEVTAEQNRAAGDSGVFGLQYDVADGDINKSLQDVVMAQATTLEAMLQSVLEAVVRTQDREDLEEPGKQTYLQELIERTSDQLALFAQNHVRVEQRIGEVMVGSNRSVALSDQCVNLLHDLEQVNTVLHANLAVARRYLDLMREQHSLEGGAEPDDDPFEV